MSNTIIRLFEHFAAAEQAREALLANGFAGSDVVLHAADDEAGPVAGNFTVGNTDQRTGRLERIVNTLTGADNHTYAGNYDRTAFHGMVRLQVSADDEQRLAKAAGIMQGFGARDAAEHFQKQI